MTSNEPIRIGLMQDWGPGRQITQDFFDALALAFDEALETGLIGRPVQTVLREELAYPLGSDEGVVNAWQDLVDNEGVLGVIGPQVAQANVLVRDLVNEQGVPMLSYCATPEFYGEYCFSLTNGFFPDEMRILIRHLKEKRYGSIGILYDDNQQGHEYLKYCRLASERHAMDIKIEVMSFHELSPAEVTQHLEKIRNAEADAFVYLGNANLLKAIGPALKAMNWNPPRFMGVPMIYCHYIGGQEGMALLDGWVGIDQYHEGNLEFAVMRNKFEQRYGRRPIHMYSAMGWDNGRTIAEALHFAPELTPKGLKIGLENVRLLPAAIGAPGNMISFAEYDHRGWKGRYLLLRKVSDGLNLRVE